MNLLLIDASNSGISGDMFLSALLELVPNSAEIIADLKDLKRFLSGIKKLEIELIKIERSGIKVNQLRLDINEEKHHRKPMVLKEALNTFLNEKKFSESGKEYANNVLNTLFEAEAEIHQELIEKIHLHEISSVDTLIDILGVTKALETMGIFDEEFVIYCEKIPLGGGLINSAHGKLPIPAPATVKIFEGTDFVVQNGPIESELVTPTGAALLVNLIRFVKAKSPETNLEKVVYSTGQKSFKNFPNILRLFVGKIIEPQIAKDSSYLKKYIEDITVLETDVDDVSGEIIGNFIKIIKNENVLDVQIIPSVTKKNRPSHIIKVLCYPDYSFKLIEKMLRELGTLGVRINTIKRVCIERKIETMKIQIDGKNFNVRFKISYFQKDKEKIVVNIKPEYEDLKKISNQIGLPLKEILLKVQSTINQISQDFID
jgi:uncharacterized protein (TIGR00299 family) protein